MRRVVCLILSAGVAAGLGCNWTQSKKLDMKHPKVEMFDPPPDEARYNLPPEDKYRKPPVNKELASRSGAGGGPMMMGGPGGQ
jgi:hypothetical protein